MADSAHQPASAPGHHCHAPLRHAPGHRPLPEQNLHLAVPQACQHGHDWVLAQNPCCYNICLGRGHIHDQHFIRRALY